MTNFGKKMMIVAMMGIMQVGGTPAVLEASSLHNNHSIVQYDDNPDREGRATRF